MKTNLKHLELFSGIGGFRQAIDRVSLDLNIDSKCIGFSEIDKFAVTSYKANYHTSEEVELGDIAQFSEDLDKLESLPNFDLLSGGFPCQPFSMMGAQRGLTDDRGNLFYAIVGILKAKKPRYLLLENVRNLKNHDNGRTYQEVIRSLTEDADYHVTSCIFNTADFGLPQNRRRIFIFGVHKSHTSEAPEFTNDLVTEHFRKTSKSNNLSYYKSVVDNLLSKNVDSKYYLSERIKPTILADGSKNFKSKSEINQVIARPLTATMVKMHRACQDNYYCDDFLNATDPIEYAKTPLSKELLAKKNIRKITPTEALKLQGFDEMFYTNASNAGVSNHQLYRQAGNAVSVNTVYYILHYLISTGSIEL